MTTRWWLALIWAGFVARLAFYATAYPLWEGFDEWAHFAVVRHMAAGAVLVPRDAPLPPDVAASLRYLPMPPTNLPAGAISHEDFWALSAEDRGKREPGAMPGITAYEALQPPLYYWLMAPVLWAARGCSVVTQVFVLRWVAILIASFVSPLVFLIGRETFVEEKLALGCAAVVALMPELAIDVARVGNDCLAIVLYTLVTWLALRRRNWPALGIALGLGLITKAYFVAAAAGVALVFLTPRAFLVAAALSGWWYVRNVVTTGTLTGLSESVMLRSSSPLSMVQAVRALPWMKAIDSILFSHLYLGGWSGLRQRSWTGGTG